MQTEAESNDKKNPVHLTHCSFDLSVAATSFGMVVINPSSG
jgi:hypothetical protein